MNTPETDKAERMAYAGEYMVPTEFARRLERERDEAKAEAARIDGAYDDATNYYARIIELIEERDEAREAFVIATDQMVVAQCKLRESTKERDEARRHWEDVQAYGIEEINAAVDLRQKLATALLERDEAQAARDILRLDAQREAEHHDRMVSELEKLYAERDEARELARQMSESNQVLMADTRFYRSAWEQLKEIAR